MQEQYIDADNDDQTSFADIYRVQIWELTLREMMVIQSMYCASRVDDLVEIVKLQGSP